MSLILEALNRADQDRASEPEIVPIPDQALLNQQPVNKQQAARLIPIALIILVTIAVTYLLTRPDSKQQTPSTFEHINPQEDTSSSAQSLIETQITPAVISASTKPVLTTKSAPSASSQSQLQPNTSIDKLYSSQQTNDSTGHNNAAKDNAVKEATPEAEAKEKKPAAKLPPLISELPPSIQRVIPNLDYNQHIYFDNHNSFIEINDQIIKSGQQLSPNLKLISIEESYSIFRYQQQEFRLPILNSWVNFN